MKALIFYRVIPPGEILVAEIRPVLWTMFDEIRPTRCTLSPTGSVRIMLVANGEKQWTTFLTCGPEFFWSFPVALPVLTKEGHPHFVVENRCAEAVQFRAELREE